MLRYEYVRVSFGNHVRQTDLLTDQQMDMRGHWEVTLPFTRGHGWALCEHASVLIGILIRFPYVRKGSFLGRYISIQFYLIYRIKL